MNKPLDPIKEATAAAALKEALGLTDADDMGLTLDTIEGETNFFEALDAALERIVTLEGLQAGLGAAIERLEARRTRMGATIKRARTALEQALNILEIEKALERPAATVGLKKNPPAVVVVEEADIPATYWKPGDPKLDRRALLAALKEREAAFAAADKIEDAAARAAAFAAIPEPIPGATLSNAPMSLNLRIA